MGTAWYIEVVRTCGENELKCLYMSGCDVGKECGQVLGGREIGRQGFDQAVKKCYNGGKMGDFSAMAILLWEILGGGGGVRCINRIDIKNV